MLIILIAIMWILLSYEYGFQGLSILVVVLPAVIFLYHALKVKIYKGFHFTALKYFLFSILRSIYISFILIIWLIKGKVHEGIYEQELGKTASYSLFFLSCGITIVPDTIFLGKRKGWIFVHKIAPTEKKAFQSDPLPTISIDKRDIIDQG